MYYVYLIQSTIYSQQTYIGYTETLQERLLAHNSSQSAHTSKYKPWELIFSCSFKEKSKALAFEKYLKTSSGKAFIIKRLL